MGSIGKGSSNTVSRRGEYSDVDTFTTPMSADDKYQVADSWDKYFNTWNAFLINKALRDAFEKYDNPDDAELQKSLYAAYRDDDFGTDSSRTKTEGSFKTIQSMDRIMLPINKDLQVTRLAGPSFLKKLLEANGLEVPTSAWGWVQSDKIPEADLKKLIGTGIKDNGFMSTTYNLSLSDSAFSDRPVQLNMKLKAGTRGAFSPTGEESEFVLDRGSTMSIKSVSRKGDRIVIDVDVTQDKHKKF